MYPRRIRLAKCLKSRKSWHRMLRLTNTFESRFFLCQKKFKAKLNITSVASFSKKDFSNLEACANYQQESFFQVKFYHPPECYKPIKMCQRQGFTLCFFAVKHPGSFISRRLYSFFYVCCCDSLTPSFRLCSFCVSCMEKKLERKESVIEN